MYLLSQKNGETYEIQNCSIPKTLHRRRSQRSTKLYDWAVERTIVIDGTEVEMYRELFYGLYEYFKYEGKWYKVHCGLGMFMTNNEKFEMKRGTR